MTPDSSTPRQDSGGSYWWLVMFLPIICCGLPALVASGALIGLVGLWHHVWPLMVAGGAVLVGAYFGWRLLRRDARCTACPSSIEQTRSPEHRVLR